MPLFICIIFAPLLIALSQAGAQAVGDVAVGLKTAGADARADGHPDILRLCAEQAAHFPHGLGREVQGRTPPACMGRANGTAHRVVEQQNNAVCRKNH